MCVCFVGFVLEPHTNELTVYSGSAFRDNPGSVQNHMTYWRSNLVGQMQGKYEFCCIVTRDPILIFVGFMERGTNFSAQCLSPFFRYHLWLCFGDHIQ